MTLNGQVLGRAAVATRAVLQTRLTRLGLTFEESVALNLLRGGPRGSSDVLAAIRSGLKVEDDVARSTVRATVTRGLVVDDGERLELAPAGRALTDELQRQTAGITERLYGDVPAEDLEVAGRVLLLVTERANAELASAGA